MSLNILAAGDLVQNDATAITAQYVISALQAHANGASSLSPTQLASAGFDGLTTITSNTTTLPGDTVTVFNIPAPTTGFSSSGQVTLGTNVMLYTGTTPTAFTGCTMKSAASATLPSGSIVYEAGFGSLAGRVQAILQIGTTVFVGGWFKQVVQLSGTYVSRPYLAALSATTLDVLAWNPNLNGAVWDMAAAPNGTDLIVVGEFTTVNGLSANHIALLSGNTSSVTLMNSTLDSGSTGPMRLNGNAYSVAVDGTDIYVGGAFSQVG